MPRDIETINSEIQQIEALLTDTAGIGTVTTDGVTTQFNQSSAERALKRLRAERAQAMQRKPRTSTIDLSGF